MKRIVFAFVLVLGFLLILSAPLTSFAQDGKGGYITVKPGVYSPTSDLDHKGFESGFNGEVAVGTYYTPNLALEAAIGYYQTEASKRGADFDEEDDVWVIPVTISFKGVLPVKPLELSLGVGGGVYFANINADGHVSSEGFSTDDSAVAWGAHAVAGATVDIGPKVFLGVEGKYVVTTTADLLDTKVNLNGFMLTGVLGYRF